MSPIYKLYNGQHLNLCIRIAGVVLLCVGSASAQTEMQPGIVRGSLIAWNGTSLNGDFTVRRTDQAEQMCHYDSHSVMSRDSKRVRMPELDKGEVLEVLADHKVGSRACYARIVDVLNPAVLRAKAAKGTNQG